jgi:hypothetical protein
MPVKPAGLKTRLWRQFQQRRHNPDRHSRPAFLVGCGRSGTSMLVLQLGRSWQIDVYNENNPAAFENWRLRESAAIQQIVARSMASVVLFKPILETYRIIHLLDTFPDSKALFAYRYYDDVIHSSLKKFGTDNRINHVNAWVEDDFSEFADSRPPAKTQAAVRSLWRPNLSPESGAALYWLFQNHLYFDLGLAETGCVRLVGYETVVADPPHEMFRLCEFLEVRYAPAMAAGIFASSVQYAPAQNVDQHIRRACEEMWQRLILEDGKN